MSVLLATATTASTAATAGMSLFMIIGAIFGLNGGLGGGGSSGSLFPLRAQNGGSVPAIFAASFAVSEIESVKT